MHLEIPQLKSMGNTHFGRFSAIKPRTTNPVILYQFVGARPFYFWKKNPDLFSRPKFYSCKVRTHASEISHLKLMGNLAFLCISTTKLYNPYAVILYMQLSPELPTLLYCISLWRPTLLFLEKKPRPFFATKILLV